MLRDGEDMRTQVHTSGRRKPKPDPKARCECWQCPRATEGRTGHSERVSSERKRGSDTV